MNGHHRILAARRLGHKNIKVNVTSGGAFKIFKDPAQRSGWERPVPHQPNSRTKMSSTKLDEV
jgi:hypothetical protein